MDTTPSPPDPKGNDRYNIARKILTYSCVGLVGLSLAIILANMFGQKGDVAAASDKVFSAMLPLLGTWVGTVLAYYFSKENFDSASKSVRDMAKQLTSDEKLRGIPVKDKLIPLAEMAKKQGDPAMIKLKSDILDYLDDAGRSRLPILDAAGLPLYVLHRSTVDKYLAAGLLDGSLNKASVESMSLAELLAQEPDIKRVLDNSFALVAENDCVSAAKAAMERINDCRDVFVTRTGQKNEPVLGWLTNIIISEAAKV